MSKRKIEKRLPEPQHSKEQKADVTSVRPAIAKPHVVRSPNFTSNLMLPKINNGHCIGQDTINSKTNNSNNLSKICQIVDGVKFFYIDSSPNAITIDGERCWVRKRSV